MGKDQEIRICVTEHQSNLREVIKQLETEKQAGGQSLEYIYLNFHILQIKDIAVTTWGKNILTIFLNVFLKHDLKRKLDKIVFKTDEALIW